MAVKDSYTLQDFTTYAQEHFPVAFREVADPSVYEFVPSDLCHEDCSVKQGEILHVAYGSYWRLGRFERITISIWSWMDSNDVFYFHDKEDNTIVSAYSPFSDLGWSGITGFRTPFSFIAERSLPRTRAPHQIARALARKRLDLLIKFVFLLTGKVSGISNLNQENLLVLFKDLCMHMHQNKQAAEKTEQGSRNGRTYVPTHLSPSRLKIAQVSVESTDAQMKESTRTTVVEQEHDRPKDESHSALPQGLTESPHNYNERIMMHREVQRKEDELRKQLRRQQKLAKKARKLGEKKLPRTAPRSNIVRKSNGSALPPRLAPPTQAGNQNSRKRTRSDSSSNTADLDHSSSSTSTQQSPEMQTILASLAQQCKHELKAEANLREEASQAEIAKLRAELLDQKRQIEAAEAEARVWKEKFDKLNKKVQSLMADE